MNGNFVGEGIIARRVGFISEKGGVGKTTACYHIGFSLAHHHQKRVLIVDADYQRGGISGRFFPEMIEQFASGSVEGTSLYHKFQQLYSDGERSTDVSIRNWEYAGTELDVLTADPRLASVSVDKLPTRNNIRENNRMLHEHLKVIYDTLTDLDDHYDYILIDSHPEVSDVLRSIIYASDYCVSPVKLDRQSSIGVATIIGEINNVNADVEMITRSVEGVAYTDTRFVGAMGMMAREYDGWLKQSEQIEYNRLRRIPGGVFEAYITEGDGLRQAAANRCPVFFINGANAEKQAEQFEEMTTEFLGQCP